MISPLRLIIPIKPFFINTRLRLTQNNPHEAHTNEHLTSYKTEKAKILVTYEEICYQILLRISPNGSPKKAAEHLSPNQARELCNEGLPAYQTQYADFIA